MSRGEKFYKNSPTMKMDKETGKMSVSREQEKADRVEDGTDGIPVHEGMETHAGERTMLKHKHIKEHMDMHTKHVVEHMAHKGDKAELHKRHHEELKVLHKEHEAEHKAMHGRHEKGETAKAEVKKAEEIE